MRAGKALSREIVRCAIYTRVSTENGLDQEFNSLDAQYEASSAYIKSQAHAGWVQVKTRYDDGGFSGGSTDRPALQSLLEDIRARKIDVIVVYKVDRLTRSLADFAKLVELFDAHRVSFVSVTQQFNTTTSMGRLTLNVLLSFAQFEREVTSERIRDKVAASKKKGIWVGGPLPLGYAMENGKVAVVPEEAERVRHIFSRYLELGSVRALMRDLKDRNIVSRRRHLKTGVTRGGVAFGCGALFHLLRNRFYIGEVNYKGQIYPGEQPPILDRDLFDRVQTMLTDQRSHQTRTRTSFSHLLTGLIFDDAGHRMAPTQAHARSILRPTSAKLPLRPMKLERRATLVAAIARGRRWLEELITDSATDAQAIATRERCSLRHVNMTLSLAFLSPALTKAAVEGRLPRGIGLEQLRELPLEWDRQFEALGLSPI